MRVAVSSSKSAINASSSDSMYLLDPMGRPRIVIPSDKDSATDVGRKGIMDLPVMVPFHIFKWVDCAGVITICHYFANQGVDACLVLNLPNASAEKMPLRGQPWAKPSNYQNSSSVPSSLQMHTMFA
eukprot:4343293-Ditylum_brightwellii.AAC.1